MGLSQSTILLDAAVTAGERYGVGTTGSRLFSGNPKLFDDFENKISLYKKSETALILNSGFQANLTVLSSLLDHRVLSHKPLVFFDKFNHASLYQAVFLSQAELVRYRHNDINHLADSLKKYQQDTRSKFIVTETLFGMDGDIISLRDIVKLAEIHQAFLYLDEAHATGILGQQGYGLSSDVNLSRIPHVVMGTFSKALGCFGAYIACPHIIKNYIINKCPGFIYTTSLSPMMIGAAEKAWELIKSYSKERQKLLDHAVELKIKCRELNFDTLNSASHIIPIILHDEKRVMYAKEMLLKNDIIVSAVRPPTVPVGTSRLRIALSAAHTKKDCERLIDALREL